VREREREIEERERERERDALKYQVSAIKTEI
jgi:hypothetical protein